MGIIIGERDSFGRRLRVARVDKARLSSLSFPGGLSVDQDACFLGAPERERGERGEIVIHHRPPPSLTSIQPCFISPSPSSRESIFELSLFFYWAFDPAALLPTIFVLSPLDHSLRKRPSS